ncbi:hypothetical protein ABZ599_38840 [Streptomyces misionensis]|uniref:hypothetical protein n=1 Tax=Streptomyces misionensis TaxID=67331 RepID=UPI0033D25F57
MNTTTLSGSRVPDAVAEVRLPRWAAPTVWLATPEGLTDIDTIAIERAVKGQRDGAVLTEDEARYAAGLMLVQHVPYTIVAQRVGRDARTLRRWFPEEAVAAPGMARHRATGEIEHGTRRGYLAHRRRGEAACGSCRAANTEADRQYRYQRVLSGLRPEVAA